MKLTKSKLKQIIKEELENIMKKEGLDHSDEDKLISLKKDLRALAADRSRTDDDEKHKRYEKIKNDIKALEDKKHQ